MTIDEARRRVDEASDKCEQTQHALIAARFEQSKHAAHPIGRIAADANLAKATTANEKAREELARAKEALKRAEAESADQRQAAAATPPQSQAQAGARGQSEPTSPAGKQAPVGGAAPSGSSFRPARVNPGDLIRAADWNAAMAAIVRLDQEVATLKQVMAAERVADRLRAR